MNGELGNGINNGNAPSQPYSSTIPVQVTNLTSNTVEIHAGSGASCARLVDGTMRCWGMGTLGTLGDGKSRSLSIPTQTIGLPAAVDQFDMERLHVCAHLIDNRHYCWGDDFYGQTGNGRTRFNANPVIVNNITPAKWTFMLYLVGDNDLSASLNQISRILEKWEREATNKSVLNIAVFYDGQGDNDSYIWSTRNAGSERWHLNEEKTSLGDPQNLSSFIQWARNNFPAEHYYLSIANHGRATTGIGWDSQSGTDQVNALTPKEIREALYKATLQGTQKIDILHFDACLMALFEMAYEVKDVAEYMIASQNLTAAFYPYDEYADLVSNNPQIAAAELANGIAQTYFNHKYLVANQQPRTISVLDLQQIDPVMAALDTFANNLKNTDKSQVDAVRHHVQVFDASPDFNQNPPSYYTLTPDDEYVDLRNLAELLSDVPGSSELQQLLEEGTGFIQYNEVVTGIDKLVSGKEWDLTDSNGISIFFPRNVNVWDYPDYIQETNSIFTFAHNSQWVDFLRTYLGQVIPPKDELDDPGIPPCSNQRNLSQHIVMVISRASGAPSM
ncbi:MAG: clostripain-related cysteine peptidase [Caldilineaceae bacterium]